MKIDLNSYTHLLLTKATFKGNSDVLFFYKEGTFRKTCHCFSQYKQLFLLENISHDEPLLQFCIHHANLSEEMYYQDACLKYINILGKALGEHD